MEKGIQIKGKNVEEAVKLAAKELNTNIENIEYTILEESNKTLFSILSPRYAIIQAKVIDETQISKKEKNTVKEEIKNEKKEIIELDNNSKKQIENRINIFLDDFAKLQNIEIKREITFSEDAVKIHINGDDSTFLIGYRGETLDALQKIIGLVISKNENKRIKIQLNIGNYREKREETLIRVANKTADRVVATRRSVALEPMIAYERKIIHDALKNHPKVTTRSVGEEPRRKTIISLKH